MFAIDNVLLSDEIIDAAFVCDLHACKGACCVDGEAGAPLAEEELGILDDIVGEVLPYLGEQARAELQKQGNYVFNEEYGFVTPTIGEGVCVYGIVDANGIVKCGIEQAFLDGRIGFKKPISCHLFPIIIDKSSDGETVYANYEPREDNCRAACKLGTKLKVPVYQFLKEPLIRRFGAEFYNGIVMTAEHINNGKIK